MEPLRHLGHSQQWMRAIAVRHLHAFKIAREHHTAIRDPQILKVTARAGVNRTKVPKRRMLRTYENCDVAMSRPSYVNTIALITCIDVRVCLCVHVWVYLSV